MNTNGRRHQRHHGLAIASLTISAALLAGCSSDPVDLRHESVSEQGGTVRTQDVTVPGPSPTVAESAAPACASLRELTLSLHTNTDLVSARYDLLATVNQIAELAGPNDLAIIYASWDLRNVLMQDPQDELIGEVWVETAGIALQDVYTACVYAGYIDRPR